MEKTELITRIIELQRKIDRARRQYGLDTWMSLSLTTAQLKSLFFISNQESTSSGHLAAALGVTPANVTGIVDRMVKQGLISRNEDTQDRRALLLKTTGKGEELVAKLRTKRRGYMSKVLARLNVDELTVVAQGLDLLVRSTEAQEGELKNEHD